MSWYKQAGAASSVSSPLPLCLVPKSSDISVGAVSNNTNSHPSSEKQGGMRVCQISRWAQTTARLLKFNLTECPLVRQTYGEGPYQGFWRDLAGLTHLGRVDQPKYVVLVWGQPSGCGSPTPNSRLLLKSTYLVTAPILKSFRTQAFGYIWKILGHTMS